MLSRKYTPDDGGDTLITEVEAAEILCLSVRTLQAWRRRGAGPSFVRAGRAVRYRPHSLREWISANTVTADQPRR